jgi:hypothetical protein
MGVTASGQATRASAGANLKWSQIQKHAAQQRQQCQMGTLISKPPAGAPLAPGSHTAAGNGHQLRVTWPAHPSLDDRSSKAPAHQPSPHAPAAPIKAKHCSVQARSADLRVVHHRVEQQGDFNHEATHTMYIAAAYVLACRGPSKLPIHCVNLQLHPLARVCGHLSPALPCHPCSAQHVSHLHSTSIGTHPKHSSSNQAMQAL